MLSSAAAQTAAFAPLRYPGHLVASRRLADGTAIVIRPIHPQDDALERAFIDSLSSDSRYNRLLSGRKLTPEEILRLTHIDYEREMAFIAVSANAARAHMLGVARYVRDAGDSAAEFALVVTDAWQRKGVGTLLLGTLLQHAHAVGIERLHGITFASNQAMQKLARKLGFVQKSDPGDATVRLVEKRLAPAITAVAAYSAAGHHGIPANDECIRAPESADAGSHDGQ